jgi:parallel beta-helix repeat protein
MRFPDGSAGHGAHAPQEGIMRLAIGAAIVLAFAGTASAATTRKVPADYANIQAAEDACVDGDTILIAKGRYILDTTVTFDVPNVIIKGAGAIVDGARPNLNNQNIDCFTINATGITVTGIKFVNGSRQIYSDGANLHVTKCTFVDPNGACIYLNTGTNAIVDGCKFVGSEASAIEGYTTNVQFLKNVVRSCEDYGFYMEGTGGRFESNTIGFIGDGEGIYCSPAANAVVLKNKITNTGNEGLELAGNNIRIEGNTIRQSDNDAGIYVGGSTSAGAPIVIKNKITYAGAGIYAYNADGCQILNNKIVDLHNDWAGVEVEADNMTVIGNSVKMGSYYTYGFYLYSQTAAGTGTVEKNSVSDVTDAGFYFGNNWFNNVEVRNCTANNCGSYDSWGFYQQNSNNSSFEGLKATNIDNCGIWHDSGDDNEYIKCSVSNVYGDGFRVQGGDRNSFTDCTAANCGADGFDNRGGSSAPNATQLSGGKYRGDRADVTNNTTGGAFIVLTNVDKVTPGTPQSQVD